MLHIASFNIVILAVFICLGVGLELQEEGNIGRTGQNANTNTPYSTPIPILLCGFVNFSSQNSLLVIIALYGSTVHIGIAVVVQYVCTFRNCNFHLHCRFI